MKIHQIPYICHFWHHKSFFTAKLVCIILVQTLHTFDKNIPSKFKFSHFAVLELKYIKFLMSFFQQFIFLLHFSSWNVTCYWQKLHIKVQILRLLLSLKFTKFVMLFLKIRANFSSNFASLSSAMTNNSSVLFHVKLYILLTKGTHQVQIFRLSNARMKINRIPCHFSSHRLVFN